jgi:DNA repair exonuclease SbcCD ATPase subunit
VYYATYKQVGEVRRANKNFAHCLACGASQKNYVPDRIVEISYEEMQAWEEIKELKEEAERVEGMFPGCVLLEVKQEILGKMEEEYKGYRHAVVLDRSGLEDLEKEYEAVKELERKVNDKITSSLMRSIAGVEDKVSKLVGERFRIRLDDFAIGYERGNSFFPFSSLSGAERAICSSALACVLANKVVKEDEISAVVIDDVGLDRGSLPALCLMLGRAVADGQIGQAIVCTMTDWGLNIDGWQKVSTDTSGVCDG